MINFIDSFAPDKRYTHFEDRYILQLLKNTLQRMYKMLSYSDRSDGQTDRQTLIKKHEKTSCLGYMHKVTFYIEDFNAVMKISKCFLTGKNHIQK